MHPSPLSKKWLFVAVLAVPFIVWLVWYTWTFLRIQRVAVLSSATVALSCPEAEISIGPSRQEGDDGPGEFVVSGCGRTATIACYDYGSRHGMIAQYFTFDLSCRAL